MALEVRHVLKHGLNLFPVALIYEHQISYQHIKVTKVIKIGRFYYNNFCEWFTTN